MSRHQRDKNQQSQGNMAGLLLSFIIKISQNRWTQHLNKKVQSKGIDVKTGYILLLHTQIKKRHCLRVGG